MDPHRGFTFFHLTLLIHRGSVCSTYQGGNVRDTIPKMTRCHFEFIADTIAEMGKDLFDVLDVEAIAKHFAKSLKATNSAFKTERFIERATR